MKKINRLISLLLIALISFFCTSKKDEKTFPYNLLTRKPKVNLGINCVFVIIQEFKVLFKNTYIYSIIPMYEEE